MAALEARTPDIIDIGSLLEVKGGDPIYSVSRSLKKTRENGTDNKKKNTKKYRKKRISKHKKVVKGWGVEGLVGKGRL